MYLPMLHPQIATTKLHSKTHWRRCEKHAPSSIQLVGWWTSISTRQQLCLAPQGEQKYWLARALPHLEHLSSSKCPPVENGLVFETVPFWNLHTFYENGRTSGEVRSDVGKKSPFRDLLTMEFGNYTTHYSSIAMNREKSKWFIKMHFLWKIVFSLRILHCYHWFNKGYFLGKLHTLGIETKGRLYDAKSIPIRVVNWWESSS